MIVAPASMLGSVTSPGAPKTTRELVSQFPGIVAAIDGSMFSYAPGEPHDYDTYRAGINRFAIHYPERGISYAGITPGDGVTLGVRATGIPYASRGNVVERGSVWAAQFFPTLVFGGVVTPSLSDVDRNKRAAVGFLRDDRAFLAVASSMSMPDFAEKLRAMGALNAGYTDGGGSAALYADIQGDGVPEYAYNLNGRRVVSWVTFEKRTLLSTLMQNASAAPTGVKVLVLACVCVLAATTVAVVVKR